MNYPNGKFQEMGEPSDPAFKAWYHGEWQDLLKAIQVPGMPHATWDRKAAWLYWILEQELMDLTGCGSSERDKYLASIPAPHGWPDTPYKSMGVTSDGVKVLEPATKSPNFTPEEVRAAIVGSKPPVNPVAKPAGLVSDGGINYLFNSGKYPT